jgi:hypothetical protein
MLGPVSSIDMNAVVDCENNMWLRTLEVHHEDRGKRSVLRNVCTFTWNKDTMPEDVRQKSGPSHACFGSCKHSTAASRIVAPTGLVVALSLSLSFFYRLGAFLEQLLRPCWLGLVSTVRHRPPSQSASTPDRLDARADAPLACWLPSYIISIFSLPLYIINWIVVLVR